MAVASEWRRPLRATQAKPYALNVTLSAVSVAAFVVAANLAVGGWMNSEGFRAIDGISRAASALGVVHGTDPHLGAVGFVWMPLPTLLELPIVAFFPLWPEVASSGFASTLVTALAGGLTAGLLILAGRRLGVGLGLSSAFAIAVASSPMILLYGGNGMSEGVAAPFLVGSVVGLTLFWRTGQRRWVAAAGIALGLATATLYEAIPFGAALGASLVVVALWGRRPLRAPHGRWRATQALGILLILPAAYVGAMWIAANWIITGDPLYFASSEYSNSAHTASREGGAFEVAGSWWASLVYLLERLWPFLPPIAALLVVRLIERRLARAETAALLALALAVPVGLFWPLLEGGLSYGWLRFFMYPLLVAAGWGLYEIATSSRRRRAAALVLLGWAVAVPTTLWAMWQPELGQEEHIVVRGLWRGFDGAAVGFADPIDLAAPVARFVEELPLEGDQSVMVESFRGYAIMVQMPPGFPLMGTADRRFRSALADPGRERVRYVVATDHPNGLPDAISRARPRLWSGEEPGFRFVREFAEPGEGVRWKVFEVSPDARVLAE